MNTRMKKSKTKQKGVFEERLGLSKANAATVVSFHFIHDVSLLFLLILSVCLSVMILLSLSPLLQYLLGLAGSLVCWSAKSATALHMLCKHSKLLLLECIVALLFLWCSLLDTKKFDQASLTFDQCRILFGFGVIRQTAYACFVWILFL